MRLTSLLVVVQSLCDWRQTEYTADGFQRFRSANLFSVASECAAKAEVGALHTLLVRHGDVLQPHIVGILDALPPTVPPTQFQKILPAIVADDCSVASVRQLEIKAWRTTQDWVELQPGLAIGTDVMMPSHNDRAEVLYGGDAPPPLTEGTVARWYKRRIDEVDSLGLVDAAFDWALLAAGKGVSDLDALLDDLRNLSTLVYECAAGDSLTLATYRSMSPAERLVAAMSGVPGESFVKELRRRGLPLLGQLNEKDRVSAIAQLVIETSNGDLSNCFNICKQSSPATNLPEMSRIIPSPANLIEFALTCINACNGSGLVTQLSDIFELLPSRESMEATAQNSVLQDQLDRLDQNLQAMEILETYGIREPLAFFRDMEDSGLSGLDSLLVKICHQAAMPSAKTDWRLLLAHLKGLQATAGHDDLEAAQVRVHELYVGALLRRGTSTTIALAKGHLASGDCPLSEETACSVAITAAQEHFNAANDSKHPELEVAALCLQLCPASDPKAAEELRLIEAMKALAELGLLIPPASVRVARDRILFVQRVLAEKKGAYKQAEQMLRLSRLLGVDTKLVLCILARTALRHGDVSTAVTYGEQLVSEGTTSWELLRDISSQSGEGISFETRRQFLGYALQHGPVDSLIDSLDSFRVAELADACVDAGAPPQADLGNDGGPMLQGRSADGALAILCGEFEACKSALLSAAATDEVDPSVCASTTKEEGRGHVWRSSWHPMYQGCWTPLAAQSRSASLQVYEWPSDRPCCYGRVWKRTHVPPAEVQLRRKVARDQALLRAAILEQGRVLTR